MDIENRKLSEIGEFGLIDRLKQLVPNIDTPELVQGIGDDAAVIKIDKHRVLLATCDIHVEGVHFDLRYITPYQLGKRVMAVNLSDIASMGGVPKYALVSLALPNSLTVGFFDDLQRGFIDQLSRYQAVIIGGNMSVSPDKIVIDVTVLGEALLKNVLERSGAKVGDRVFVTGQLGASAAGRHLLTCGKERVMEHYESLLSAFLQPVPRIETGRLLAKNHLATAMIDVSDGLAADLNHVCLSSGVGAEIFAVNLPFSPELEVIAREIGADMRDMVLYGGEDYELLFTSDKNIDNSLIQQVANQSGVQITEIGRIVQESKGIVLVDQSGKYLPLKAEGWDHFRSIHDD